MQVIKCELFDEHLDAAIRRHPVWMATVY